MRWISQAFRWFAGVYSIVAIVVSTAVLAVVLSLLGGDAFLSVVKAAGVDHHHDYIYTRVADVVLGQNESVRFRCEPAKDAPDPTVPVKVYTRTIGRDDSPGHYRIVEQGCHGGQYHGKKRGIPAR